MPIKCFRLSPNDLIPLNNSASTLDLFTASVSDGFYSTFSTLNNGTRVLGLTAHLQRLYIPAHENKLTPSANEIFLRKQIAMLAKENLPDESRIRIILTKDTGDVYIAIQPFESLPDSVYQNGVHVITSSLARTDPRIKDTSFISKSNEQRKLLNKDVFEVLLTKNGKILEGMTSNFYVIARPEGLKQSPTRRVRLLRREEHPPRNDEILITAQRGILLGVTRRVVLKIAREQGMMIEYRAPSLNETCSEAFLTSSSRGVVPVVAIDNKSVGQGGVGNWTKKLRSAYQNYVYEKAEAIEL